MVPTNKKTTIEDTLINEFHNQVNAIKAGQNRPKDIPIQPIKTIAVIGAGMMGCGIAYESALAGMNVILIDIDQETAQAGKSKIEQKINLAIKNGKRKITNKRALLDNILTTDQYKQVNNSDIIIEAVFEKYELKETIIQACDKLISQKAVLASNTSTLPISLLSSTAHSPEQFIGLHFFSPVERMPLVEIILGQKTSKETLASAFDYVIKIGKTPIVVRDSRGFFTTRVFGTYIDEGSRLLEEGLHPITLEELAQSTGMPVGPLAIHDEISQRLTLEINETNKALDKKLNSHYLMGGKYCLTHAKLLAQKYNRGGRAYGGGFYEYPKDAKKQIWAKIIQLFHKKNCTIPNQDVKDRLIFRQVIEAIKCFEEGVVNTVSEANIGSVYGIGFPIATGGILEFINSFGLKAFILRANELASRYGDRFEPPKLLHDYLRLNKPFK